MAAKTYSMREVQEVSGVQARTLRHWIRHKVLSKPLGRGRAARYTEQHVLRARVIGQLRSKRLPLRDIRAQLGRLTDEQMVAMLPRARGAHLTPEGLPEPPPAPSYPAVMWEVVALMEGLVLMVNSSKAPGVRRVADDIYRHYSVPPTRTA